MAKTIVNTMMLLLRRYLNYLQYSTHSCLEQTDLTEFINRDVAIKARCEVESHSGGGYPRSPSMKLVIAESAIPYFAEIEHPPTVFFREIQDRT